ncbi:MAG: AbrB/MazE/SpoVT family DNA-binding domain-containing protein [Planctomycetes bacterium]|nr:AbrB/MazE/SpoVT family DNA-binding domain-containing protein [Planctomycetota bacterium]
MKIVKISSKFQIVIPKEIREKLELSRGQKIQFYFHEGQMMLIPERAVESMRGFLKISDTSVPRDKDRI